MATDEDVEQKLAGLTDRTSELGVPRGLEARVVERLRGGRDEPFWEVAWFMCRRALPLAFVAAALAVAIAFFEDRVLTDVMSRSGYMGMGVDTRDP